MDGPNSGGSPSGSGGQKPANNAEYTHQVREAMNERRRNVTQALNHFRPHVHDQMNRLFSSYEAPLYARLRGFTSSRTIALAESSITALAAGSNRSFDDQETQALAEYVITGVNRNVVCKWALTAFAGYMTYRGRKTFRFPFITPAGGGLFDPFKGPSTTKMGWHMARFAAYNVFAWVAIEPMFQMANMVSQKSAMMADPRLRSVMKSVERGQQPASMPGQMQGQGQDTSQWGGQEASSSEYSYSPQQQQPQQSSTEQPYYQSPQSYSQPQSQPQQQQSSWTSYSQPTSSQSQQQQPNDAWGSSAVEDFDDASPVAPGHGGGSQGGSAWDRVRQQSQQQSSRRQQPRYQQQQQQQPQQQWGQQQSQSNEWGNVDDASPQRSPVSESYTYSAADEERVTAKTQAQKEFDALVERERYGVEQGQSGWGRK
ncbi:hypothetical protein K4F52_002635 [Lecanicillium sp. MT-2017a]|nr:hypothetical protein K4F52_002635 [Lecanicillium sp. MT-2017a]